MIRIFNQSKVTNIKRQLKKVLTGLDVPQEYVCLNLAAFKNSLSVFLTLKGEEFNLDVTKIHLFLGYKPLIIAFSFNASDEIAESMKRIEMIELNFNIDSDIRKFRGDKHGVARVILKKIGEKVMIENYIFIFEGVLGEHSFLNPFHQMINRLRGKMRSENPENISLPGNLYEQVRIAYSIPRIISVITLSDGLAMNMFPTDLHGPVSHDFYAGSLRIGGLANAQVEKLGRIVVSQVEAQWYRQVYKLGKNHMGALEGFDNFELHHERSYVFGLPLPKPVVSYCELERIDSFDAGIHRIHFYRIINQKMVSDNSSLLAHVHQYYAQWRQNQGQPINMLLR